MNIRNKLVVLLLGISLVPLFVVSLVAYRNISQQLTPNILGQLEATAVKQEQRINSLLERSRERSLNLAGRFALENDLKNYLGSKDAKYVTELDQLLLDTKSQTLDTQAISIAGVGGKVLASTEKEFAGTSLTEEPYFNKALQSDGFYFIQDPESKLPKLYFTSRILVESKLLGVMVTTFTTDEFTAIVQDYTGLGKTGETLLTEDKNGQAISLIPLRFDLDAAFKTNLSSLNLTDAANRSYTNLTDYRGHKALVATRYIDLAGWNLATKIDRDEAFAPISSLRNILLGILAVSSVVIVLVALYIARLFTAPVIALTNKTRLIIQGDLNQKIEITSSDEIGTLASAFNTMVANLRKLYEGLEQKVTERTKQLDEKVQELKQANAKDEVILSSMGEGLIVTDQAGRLVLMNPMAKDLLGIEVSNYAGQELGAIANLTEEDGTPHSIKDSLKDLGRLERTRTSSLTLTKKDASTVAIGMTIAPVIENNQLLGAIGILRDTTKEREVNRMKTEFISLASHQLRTPLSAIKWFSEMLLDGDAGALNKEQKEFMANVADSAERMIDLVNGLLNISRMESGRIIVDPKPTDLNELVSGIVNDLHAKIEERQQNLVISVHHDLPKINLDPQLIGQVYLNLMSNAIKYTPKGGEISVIVSRSGDQLLSQVTDNGYGIPKSEQSKMFQKFFRATNITKVETDGTGLGMYLVKAIVESSGGKIWFDSEEGKGTTFWFSLPMTGMKAKAGEVVIGS